MEAMSREGFVGVRLLFKLPDITTFEYRSAVSPPRRSRLARSSPCRGRGPAENPAHAGGLWRQDRGRSSRPPDPKSGVNSEGFKALLRSIDAGRTWVKVSGGYRLGPQAKQYAPEILRVAGPDRLVWASDCPFVGHEGQFPYQATMDWLVEAIPDADARARIFGATARELYFNGE
jgi:hypothetical protein